MTTPRSADPAPEDDARHMRRAIALGQAVQGRTGDNPAVGCVVVRAGEVVGEGATQPPGQPHAEVMAIRDAEARGIVWAESDLYVTLEPCTFQGRTPPCVERILNVRPRRVVVAVRDPHPRVNGAGIAALQAAGLEVVEGVLAPEAEDGLRDWLATFR